MPSPWSFRSFRRAIWAAVLWMPWILGGLAGLWPTAAGAENSGRLPHLVVILADDLSAAELGCYGHLQHRTPHLDQLAATGVKFETAFACPVCHPTRFMLLTGQYGSKNGVYNFPGRRGGPPVADQGADNIARHVIFPRLVREAGYATAVAGKWQLSGRPPELVKECGFDEYQIWGYREYYTDEQAQAAAAAGIVFRSRYWRPSIIENGRWRPTSDADYGPDLFLDFLLDFLRRHRDRPCLLYYPLVLTHSPWVPTPDSLMPGDDKQESSRRHFAANVAYVDKLVGRLVAGLEELGLRDETVLFFTADNATGGDGKSQPTERGARVPLIVNGPGLIRSRGDTAELSDLSDLFPTLVELAGGELPTQTALDGRSLAPFLRGEAESTREWIFAYQADRRVLRTKRWLLEDNSPRHPGRLYDCGDARDGQGYRDVTDSAEPEVRAARAEFERLLADLPSPHLAVDGPANGPAVESVP